MRQRSTDSGQSPPDSCDVVIIGAGVGGLTAGSILAKAGLHTIVFDANSEPGGYLAGFERRGFRFDSSIHWLSQCGPGGFVRNILNYAGNDDMPECPQLHRAHRFKGESFDYILTTEPMALRDQMVRDFPEDRAGIVRFFNDAERLGEHLRVFNRRVQSKETMSFFEKIVYNVRMMNWVMPVLKYIRTPVDKALSNYFKSPEVRSIFASQETFMSIIVTVAWASIKNFQSAPAGGSAALAKWLCHTIDVYGSMVCTGQRVEQVLVDKNKIAAGVQLSDGHRLASRYVIAACDVQTLFNDLLPAGSVSARLQLALNNADLHASSFSIFLGLDCAAADLGFGEEVLNLVVSNPNRKDHINGDPHRSIIMVVAFSSRDPQMAPAGKGSLMIQCPARMDYRDNWATGEGYLRGDAYRRLKAEYAEIIIDRVAAAVAPDLKNHIEVMETATPVTYWRYTANTGGTTMGVRPTGKNIRARVASYKTPVKNLFVGGHCAEYGGGVPMAVRAGANSSLMVLKDLRHDDFVCLKKVMNGQA